jgi:hypothetical protein
LLQRILITASDYRVGFLSHGRDWEDMMHAKDNL